jgi:lysophospholipase L1-like esterase
MYKDALKRETPDQVSPPDRQLKILCYGDSNTWGFNPTDGSRFPEHIRWPGVLRRCLGDEFMIIEEGLNGRTLCAFGMEGDALNGSEHLFTLLKAYEHLDLLILYLGINDLFVDPHISSMVLVKELEDAVDRIRKVRDGLSVLLLAPLPVNIGREYGAYYHEQIAKSFELIEALEKVAVLKGCHFLDPSQVISASRSDGVHIEAEEHIKLGMHLCMIVRDLFPDLDSPSLRNPGG